jgi:hypothetical protein
MKSWCIRTFRSSGVSALQISTRLFLTKNKQKMSTAPCCRLIVLQVQICTVTCSCCFVRIFVSSSYMIKRNASRAWSRRVYIYSFSQRIQNLSRARTLVQRSNV